MCKHLTAFGCMTDDHKAILLRKRESIVENIQLDSVMNAMYSQNVLTPRDVSDIKARFTSYQRAETFLDILALKQDAYFGIVKDILISHDQSHVAHLFN